MFRLFARLFGFTPEEKTELGVEVSEYRRQADLALVLAVQHDTLQMVIDSLENVTGVGGFSTVRARLARLQAFIPLERKRDTNNEG